MSKQCPACGNVLPDDAIFCDQCGNKLPVVPENKSAAEEEPLYCRFCGTKFSADAKFCLKCGAPRLRPDEEIEPLVIDVPEGTTVVSISDAPPSDICMFCGAVMDVDQSFCPVCGAPRLKPGESVEELVLDVPEGTEVIIGDAAPKND